MKKFMKILKYAFDRWKRLSLSGADYARYLGVEIGEGSDIITRDFGSEPFLISIGKDCVVTHGVQFITHDASTRHCIDARGRRFLLNRITLGDRVFIGLRTIILPGVRIGDDVIVGAGSVVTKSIPSGWIVAGNPAKIIADTMEYRANALANLPSQEDLPPREDFEIWAKAACQSEFKQELVP